MSTQTKTVYDNALNQTQKCALQTAIENVPKKGFHDFKVDDEGYVSVSMESLTMDTYEFLKQVCTPLKVVFHVFPHRFDRILIMFSQL